MIKAWRNADDSDGKKQPVTNTIRSRNRGEYRQEQQRHEDRITYHHHGGIKRRDYIELAQNHH
jgi:hypothetical protein